MNEIPTRQSLIKRLGDFDDEEAWSNFSQIYEGLIRRQCRSYGLKSHETNDVVQEVLIAVAKRVDDFDFDPSRGRFRTWLFAVGRNIAYAKLRQRQRIDQAAGGSRMTRWLNEQPRPEMDETKRLDQLVRQEAFRMAALLVEKRVEPKTWHAFRMTAIEGKPATEVAQDLNISVANVYVAKSRTMDKIRSTGHRLMGQSEPGP